MSGKKIRTNFHKKIPMPARQKRTEKVIMDTKTM